MLAALVEVVKVRSAIATTKRAPVIIVDPIANRLGPGVIIAAPPFDLLV